MANGKTVRKPKRGPALIAFVRAQEAQDDARRAISTAVSHFETKTMALKEAIDRLDRLKNPQGPLQQFTHEELRCLLDAVSQHVENEDPEDDETKVPGHPAAHSAKEKLEIYFASFADPPPREA